MKVIEHYYDPNDEDGFYNMFILDTGHKVLTTEKSALCFLGERSDNPVDESYKAGLNNPSIDTAIDNYLGAGHLGVSPVPFTEEMKKFFEKHTGIEL